MFPCTQLYGGASPPSVIPELSLSLIPYLRRGDTRHFKDLTYIHTERRTDIEGGHRTKRDIHTHIHTYKNVTEGWNDGRT
jgi:hypothetical protein